MFSTTYIRVGVPASLYLLHTPQGGTEVHAVVRAVLTPQGGTEVLALTKKLLFLWCPLNKCDNTQSNVIKVVIEDEQDLPVVV